MMTQLRKSSKSLEASQTPTKEKHAKWVRTEIEQCAEVARLGNIDLLEWQYNVLENWLGRDRSSRWAHSTVGMCVPRQNGKTLGVVVPYIAYQAVVYAKDVIYTSQVQSTSTETFEELRFMLECPALAKHVKRFQGAIGREKIFLRNGACIKFLARTNKSGRGQHADIMIFDEAQLLTSKMSNSFKYVTAARKSPVTLYLGTAPDDILEGEMFYNIRENILSGKSRRASWDEWGVVEIGDVYDKTRWYATNPSLGLLIKEENVENELTDGDETGFAIDRLGYWLSRKKKDVFEPIIKKEDWQACEIDPSNVDLHGKRAFGVKFSPDGSTMAVAVCEYEAGRPAHVELVDVENGAAGAKLASSLVANKNSIALVAVDGKGAAADLVVRLEENGFPKLAVVQTSTRQAIEANSMFVNAIVNNELTHIESPALDSSVLTSVKRPIGKEGAFGFGDGKDGICTPTEASALAYWAAKTTRRDPRRRAVIR